MAQQPPARNFFGLVWDDLKSHPAIILISVTTTILAVIGLFQVIEDKYQPKAVGVAIGFIFLLLFSLYNRLGQIQTILAPRIETESRIFVGPQSVRMESKDGHWRGQLYMSASAVLPDLRSAVAELQLPVGIRMIPVGTAAWYRVSADVTVGEIWRQDLQDVHGHVFLGMFEFQSEQAPNSSGKGLLRITGSTTSGHHVAVDSTPIVFYEAL
jgi:hypothetical protein